MNLRRTWMYCSVVVALCVSSAAQAQLANAPWPKFHADIRNTGVSNRVAMEWTKPRWGFATGGPVISSPAIKSDGVIFFTSQDGKLYAVNSDSTLRWQYDIGNTGSSSPAISADGAVIVGSTNGYLYAFNLDGTLRWRYNLGSPANSSPSIGPDGAVYVCTDIGYIYSFTASGYRRWRYSAASGCKTSPAIGLDGNLYFGCEDGSVYSVKPSSGTYRWRKMTGAPVRSSPAASLDGIVYIGSDDGYFYAFKCTTGDLQWKTNLGTAIRSSPALTPDGTLYVGTQDGSIVALSTTGGIEWRFMAGGAVASSPAVDIEGTIYFGCDDGRMYAVKPDGTLRWKCLIGSSISSSPAIGMDGATYVGCADGKLYGFGDDTSPPTTPVVTDDGAYTSDPSCLHAGWSSTDPQTGIAEYAYAIGRSCGGTDVVGWTSAGKQTSITACGLSLSSGATYYFSVKAKNGTDVWSEVGCSDGIKTDLSPPSTPVVADDGQFTWSVDTLHARWTSSDSQSGIARYEYCIGTSKGAGDVLNCRTTTADETMEKGLALQNGRTYYFTARSQNGAGLWSSPGYSDGITCDSTPPTTPIVVDEGEYASAPARICAQWSSNDPESGIVAYSYALGTSAGDMDVVGWTSCGTRQSVCLEGLPLVGGVTYYMCVRATNGAGRESEIGCSDGVRIDTTPPSNPEVFDEGRFTYNTTSLHAAWKSGDSETGVVEYVCAIGTAPGALDIRGWGTVGQDAEFTFTDLDLVNGQTYYVSVRAKNAAGLWSDVGSSDGITVETTPPTTPVVVDEGDYTFRTDTLYAEWSSSDLESGIVEYMYSVGTSPGAGNLVGWTSVGQETFVTVSNLSLVNGQIYYFAVKALNGAGQWSAVGVSNGIQSRPTAPAWGKFRADTGNTGTSPFVGSQTGHLQWNYETGGWVDSSPVVLADGSVIIGSGDGALYCVRNGSLRWKHQTEGSIDSSPAVDANDRVYVGSYDKRLYALTSTGSVKWAFYTLGPIVASPAISQDGTVYVGSLDGRVYAVGSNGSLKWYVSTGGQVTSSTAICPDGGICVGSGDGKLYMINTNGTIRWRYRTGSAITASPAIGANGNVYVGSGDGYFYAISPAGVKLWSCSAGQVFESSAAIAIDGVIYAATSADWSQTGYLYAFESDGHIKWRAALPSGTKSSPAIGKDGIIYIGADDFRLYAFDRNGNLRWSALTQGVVHSSPAVGRDGSICVGSSDGRLYCIKDLPYADTTPPSIPIVQDDGDFTPAVHSLHAYWMSDDAETGISGYEYAIGLQPGLADVVNWTAVGPTPYITQSGLNLTIGQPYYFAVKARNGMGLWSAVGVSDGIVVAQGIGIERIGEAKSLPDGTEIYMHEKAVTAAFEGEFCIEDLDRSAGITVASNEGVQVGELISVAGHLSTGVGQRIINAGLVKHIRRLEQPVAPLFMPNASVCKRARKPQLSSLTQAVGLENIAMLVRTSGCVMEVGDSWFIVEDGSMLMETQKRQGLLIRCGALSKPKLHSYVTVTGIARIELDGLSPIRTIRIRTAADIVSVG